MKYNEQKIVIKPASDAGAKTITSVVVVRLYVISIIPFHIKQTGIYTIAKK